MPFLNSEKYSRGSKTGKTLTREENNTATHPKALHISIKTRDHVAYWDFSQFIYIIIVGTWTFVYIYIYMCVCVCVCLYICRALYIRAHTILILCMPLLPHKAGSNSQIRTGCRYILLRRYHTTCIGPGSQMCRTSSARCWQVCSNKASTQSAGGLHWWFVYPRLRQTGRRSWLS